MTEKRVLKLIAQYEKDTKQDYYWLTLGVGVTSDQALSLIALRNGYRRGYFRR